MFEVIEFDATGIDMNKTYSLMPDGKYRLTIKSVEQSVTKKGYTMFTVVFECEEPDYLGSRVYHNVVVIPKGQKGEGMALSFLKAIGEPWEGKIQINPNNWLEKSAFAFVTQETYNQKTRNKIANFLGEDEVPF
jgi:hypothetical protein